MHSAATGETVIDGLLQLMDSAHHELLIVSPYFVPGAQMMERFRQLKQRGVRVRVLTNSLASNDAPAAHAGYARYRKDLLEAGVELHEMRAAQGVTGFDAEPNVGLGSAGGGSKGNGSRASLHSKAVVTRWLAQIDAGEWEILVADLLASHYDPAYARSMGKSYPGMTDAAVLHAALLDDAGFDHNACVLLDAAFLAEQAKGGV